MVTRELAARAAAARSGGVGSTLGSSAKSVHKEPGRSGSAESKRNRYSKLKTAQRLLWDSSAEHVHRTCKCHRRITSEAAGIGVWQGVDVASARLSGVGTCGSVWACPVCAMKIASGRQVELEFGQVAAHARGKHGYLLTLTFPHEAGMPLADITGAFGKALQKFKNSSSYKGYMRRHGRIGSVKGLEVTHGGNGWHPHVHELVWALPGLLEDTRGLDRLKAAWVDALLKCGLGSSEKRSDMLAHALDFRGGDDAAAYIAKYGRGERYGLSNEVLPTPTAKAGRGEHATVWQLLERAEQGDREAGELFREYAMAFEGKRALTWTPGLKDLLGVRDMTDDDLAAMGEEPKPEETIVGRLTVDQYQAVWGRDLLADLLWIVATWPGMQQNDLDELVDGWIAHTPRRSSGRCWLNAPGGEREILPSGHYHA